MDAESKRAVAHWHASSSAARPASRADTDVTNADIAAHNLILWGDPSRKQRNPGPHRRKTARRLGRQTDSRWAGKTFDTTNHVALLIYPNPLNPEAAYVVLNSGFTLPATMTI